MPNGLKTALLLGLLSGLLLAIGEALGGSNGMMIALVLAAVMNFGSYWFSDKIVLRMYRAQEVAAGHRLYTIVERLTRQANLPMPKVYIIPDPSPNAFATGRNAQHAAVAATEGILQVLTDSELEGVVAHELAHVKHRDTLTMTIAATVAGAVGMVANLAFFFGGPRDENGNRGPMSGVIAILAMLLAPIAATLVQLAISRTREYEADRGGAEISGHPLWLASALGRLEQAAHAIPNPRAAENPATAHLFIVNPLAGGGMASLFATHPSMADRIRRLRDMAGVAKGPWG
jgi:heat shock protein HtpX